MIKYIKLPYILGYLKKMQIYGESESISNQKTLLRNYVKEAGYELVDTYIDDGCTGTNFDRPAFQRMIKDIEKRKNQHGDY